jgi:hypothetical protein
MIVRPNGTNLDLITQPDHAQLAGDIMSHSLELQEEPRRRLILEAIRAHDNGWSEEDAAPSVHPETGHVMDFINAPLIVRQRVWPRGIRRLAEEPWVAALVAQHAITVYDRFRPLPDWQEFFRDIEIMREDLRRESGMPLAELLADYRFVRLGDLISLTFCTATSDELRYAGWSVRLEGNSVVVRPDPFGGKRIPVAIAAREIPGGSFESDTVLTNAWRNGTTITLRAEVRGA